MHKGVVSMVAEQAFQVCGGFQRDATSRPRQAGDGSRPPASRENSERPSRHRVQLTSPGGRGDYASEPVAARSAMVRGLQRLARPVAREGVAPTSLYLAAGSHERRSCIAMVDSVLGLCFCNAARPLALVGKVKKQETASSRARPDRCLGSRPEHDYPRTAQGLRSRHAHTDVRREHAARTPVLLACAFVELAVKKRWKLCYGQTKVGDSSTMLYQER